MPIYLLFIVSLVVARATSMAMTAATDAQLAAATFACGTPSGALADVGCKGIPRRT